MKRLVLAVAIVLVSAIPALALCVVPTPLPSTPLPPVFTGKTTAGSTVDVWREPCLPGSTPGELVLYVKLTPHTSGVFFSGFQTAIQNSQQVDVGLSQTPDGFVFSGEVFIPITFLLEPLSGQPPFDTDASFLLLVNGAQINVAAGGAQPPSPPGVQVVVTGCNPCKIGDLAKLHLHVTNPGPARVVEVKAGSHFPDGVTNFVFLGRYVELEIPSGESDIDIPGLTLPAGLPFGTYTIEGALLEPDFGTTLSRHSVTAALNP